MIASGDGRIVNIGSIAGVMPYPFGSAYNASKAALHAYGNTLRLELAPFKCVTLFAALKRRPLTCTLFQAFKLPPCVRTRALYICVLLTQHRQILTGGVKSRIARTPRLIQPSSIYAPIAEHFAKHRAARSQGTSRSSPHPKT